MGEATLDRDGVLHGWCWSPRRPTARLALEFLVDNAVVATTTASRFREDVRNRHFGDGYHGFNVALTKQLSGATPPRMVAAREAETGRVFWQTLLGDFAIPAGLHERVADAEAGIRTAAWSQALDAPGPGRLALAAAGLGAAGRRLQEKAKAAAPGAPNIMLPYIPSPAISLILDGGADAGKTLALIAAAAGTIGDMQAELIILDQGGDPRNIHLASQVTNARYVYAASRNIAAADAMGETLVFLRNTGRRIDLGLGQLAATRHHGPIVAPAIAALAGHTAPDRFIASPDASYLGLDLAISRNAFIAAGGFAEHMDEDSAAADLLLRGLGDGTALIWREPRGRDSPAFAFARGRHGF
jgi:hypothetical protein